MPQKGQRVGNALGNGPLHQPQAQLVDDFAGLAFIAEAVAQETDQFVIVLHQLGQQGLGGWL